MITKGELLHSAPRHRHKNGRRVVPHTNETISRESERERKHTPFEFNRDEFDVPPPV